MSNIQSTILIVDDEALFRSSVVDALQDANPAYTVLEAANGREALHQIAAATVDVVVTDISMPVMDGLELILQLGNQAFGGAVIVVTAFGDSMLRSEVAMHGGFGYLEKPIDLPELIKSVRSAAEGERPVMEGLSLPRFVRLLELERKTCLLRVVRRNQTGDLLFRDGVMMDARLGDDTGNEAAFELLSWNDDVRLEMQPGVQSMPEAVQRTAKKTVKKAVRETVELDVSSLIGSGAVQNVERKTDESTVALDTTKTDESAVALATNEKKEYAMGNVAESLNKAMEVDGAIGVALVDHESGMSLGQSGGGNKLNLDVAGAGNTAVVRAKMRVMGDLGLDDKIEDILITLSGQYHLIRPLATAPNLFLYLALDRGKANLAMARHQLGTVEKELKV